MRFFAERMKLLVEPTGCLGLAAALKMGGELRGKRVGVILSGGNIDLQRFCGLSAGNAPSVAPASPAVAVLRAPTR